MWLKALIWLVILIKRFVRASREADLPLHIHHTFKLMLPYFVAAGHWDYLSYASVYLVSDEITKKYTQLKKFLVGEHAMRH